MKKKVLPFVLSVSMVMSTAVFVQIVPVAALDATTFGGWDGSSQTYDDPANLTAQGWTMTFDDEFDSKNDLTGTTPTSAQLSPGGVNLNNWTFETGTGSSGWGNNEMESYTNAAANASVANGVLTITATPQSGKITSGTTNTSGNTYTSARMKTAGLFSQTYGRFSARIKFPTNDKGFWPAFWMMPASPYDTTTWPLAGEIDIAEAKSRLPQNVSGTVHYGGGTAGDQYTSANFDQNSSGGVGNYPGYNIGGWNIYTAEWGPGYINFYVNDILYAHNTAKTAGGSWYTNDTTQTGANAPFDHSFYMILNLAVGGNFDSPNWPNGTSGGSTGQMQVDWVRAYQATANAPVINSVTASPSAFQAGGANVSVTVTATNVSGQTVNVGINGVSGTYPVTFSSTNSNGQSVGTATIPAANTASLSGNYTVGATIAGVASTASAELNVTAAATGSVAVTSVAVSPGAANLAAGQTLTLTAAIAPVNASNQNVTWSSNNTAVATVNATTGAVTSVGPGKATITATTASGSLSSACIVNDIAAGAAVTASSTGSGVAAANLTNGTQLNLYGSSQSNSAKSNTWPTSASQVWTPSSTANPCWVMVDLGAVYNLSEVDLVWQDNCAAAANYQIALSNTWTGNPWTGAPTGATLGTLASGWTVVATGGSGTIASNNNTSADYPSVPQTFTTSGTTDGKLASGATGRYLLINMAGADTWGIALQQILAFGAAS